LGSRELGAFFRGEERVPALDGAVER